MGKIVIVVDAPAVDGETLSAAIFGKEILGPSVFDDALMDVGRYEINVFYQGKSLRSDTIKYEPPVKGL